MKISLTNIEVRRILDACTDYIEIMSQREDTCEYTEYELEEGLGSALRKLYKGRIGENVYAKYKTVRQCPTFEEWKATRAESEDEE